MHGTPDRGQTARYTQQASLSRRHFLAAGAAGLAAASAVSAALPAEIPAWEPISDRRVRIGVVGGRFGKSFHWHEHPNCEVYAVSDLLPDRKAQLMERYQCSRSYDSLEELVLDDAIEAVALFTPAPDHARHTLLCFEHGKHVVSACPACLTIEEAEALKEAKERTGLTYMSAETSYYRWDTIAVRDLYRAGELGDIVYSEAEYYHPNIGRADDGLSMFNGERTWRYGFPPMLYPTHSTAFLVGVTGERLVEVSCIGTGDPNEPSLKDNAYDSPFLNGMGLFRTDRGHPFRCNVAWDVQAHGERAQWFGKAGTVYMASSGGQPFLIQIGKQTYTELPNYWPLVPEAMRYDTGHGKSHPFLTHEFIAALVEERAPAIDLYEALAYCVPGIVAHQSSFKDGEQLAIPQFDPVKA